MEKLSDKAKMYARSYGQPSYGREIKGTAELLLQMSEKLAEYEDLEERLQAVYGECGGLLEKVVEHLECHEGVDLPEPVFKARLLTDSEVDRWQEYKKLEEQGRLLIVPDIKKNKTLYWIWGNEIMPVLFKRITSCVVDDMGNPHVMCEMTTKKDRTFVHTCRRKYIENTFKAGDKRYFYSEDIGKTIFFTREEAEAALKELEDKEV